MQSGQGTEKSAQNLANIFEHGKERNVEMGLEMEWWNRTGGAEMAASSWRQVARSYPPVLGRHQSIGLEEQGSLWRGMEKLKASGSVSQLTTEESDETCSGELIRCCEF
jgi:hypothetical protein